MNPTLMVTCNASGALEGARLGHVVMVVDLLDMSTTLEAALDGGAIAVFGASPDRTKAPVEVNPEKVGFLAGKAAREKETEVIIIGEPRVGTDEERKERASLALRGVARSGAKIGAIVPNIGAETAKLTNFQGKVVLAVTDTGGVAFDAALTAGAPTVITGTIARSMVKKGTAPARASAQRAITAARMFKTGITIVAASANSLEDILAAQYIAGLIWDEGFTLLDKTKELNK